MPRQYEGRLGIGISYSKSTVMFMNEDFYYDEIERL